MRPGNSLRIEGRFGAPNRILLVLPSLVTLLVVGGAWSLWLRREGAPGDSSKIPTLEVQKVLDETLAKHRAKAEKTIPCQANMPEEWALAFWHKERLLALAYPGTMERLLLSRVKDPALDSITKAICASLLGVLSKSGRKQVDAVLLGLADSPDKAVAQEALRELSEGDVEGRYRDLYLRKCREQVWCAFDAVAFWPEPASIRELKRIIADCPGNSWPQSELRLSAQETLDRLEILASPDAGKILIGILDGSGFERDRLPWAIRMARSRSVPGIVPALRRRLDRCEEVLPENAPPEQREDYARLVKSGYDVEGRIAAGRVMGTLCAQGFDEALLALAELGGPLREIERRRLRAFGYFVDPKERLEEILASER